MPKKTDDIVATEPVAEVKKAKEPSVFDRMVAEKMAAGLAHDQAVDVATLQLEHDAATGNQTTAKA